jgi:hypothetical protein
LQIFILTLRLFLGGQERWFNLTVINLQEEDADDYTCVAVNAGGVSEQNVSLTFDTPALEPNREEPPERDRHFSTLIAAVVGGKERGQRDWWRGDQ